MHTLRSLDPTVLDFLSAVCGNLRPDEAHVVVNRFWKARQFAPGDDLGDATHLSIGLFKKEQEGRYARSYATWTGSFMVVCDDVGETKQIYEGNTGEIVREIAITPPPLQPTYILETKPGSQQWGYVFDRICRDADQMETIINTLIEAGHNDPGARQRIRVVRLPLTDPKGRGYPARLLDIRSDRRFDPNSILDEMGLNPTPIVAKHALAPIPAPDGVMVVDKFHKWLGDNGYLLSGPKASGWYDALCPFSHLHPSRPDEGFGYKPATADDLNRKMVCQHATCSGRRFSDFAAQFERMGAVYPAKTLAVVDASTIDPVQLAKLKELFND